MDVVVRYFYFGVVEVFFLVYGCSGYPYLEECECS